MTDVAFHITALVTAVGYDEYVSLESSLQLEAISAIIGITMFPLSFSNPTGILLDNHPPPGVK
jgi:hypothetical protein